MCWACCSGRRWRMDASRMRNCSPFSLFWRGRIWRAGIAVNVGDVFTYKGALWRCIQPHTTQDDWAPT